MPICETRKLAFCHIPRTGGVSICNGLNLKVKDKHFPASYYRKAHPDYTLFATIRSYEDRVKSTFGWRIPEDRQGRADSFQALVDMIIKKGGDNIGLMLKPNEYFLDCEVDFLLRYEYLQEDLNSMLTKLGHEPVKLIQCNSFRQMNIPQAIDRAKRLESKLTPGFISKLDGYSNPKVWHLLNNLVSQVDRYLEVGLFKGSTLSAALFGNDVNAFAVDNFSYGVGSRELFYKNTDGMKFEMFEQDAWTVDRDKIQNIQLYFYDGDHSFESHKKALTYYAPCMAKEFVYVCDDWDVKRVPNATFEAAKELGLKIVEKWELPGNNHADFWSGIGIVKFMKP